MDQDNLDMQCEELTGARWKELVPSLNKYKTIRLADCSLSSSSCADIASVLTTSQVLTVLKLNTNELGDSGVELLCKGLMSPSCNLQTLWLEFCEFSAASTEALCSALRTKSSLKALNLNYNKLKDRAVKHLCQALLDANCKLQSLQLESCGITAAGCGDLSALLSAMPSLTELSLGENKIGDAGVAVLCQGLLNPNCKIEKLRLWECAISPAGCKDLSNVINTKETLQVLSVVGNDFKDQGMEFLCQALKDPKTKLQSLWLRDCGLTAACCKSVGSIFSTNVFLKELHIGSNQLEDAGMAYLCEGLMNPNCQLQSLWVGNAELTAACCDQLAAVLVTNQHLEELELCNNWLENEGVLKLCEAVRNPNCKLKMFMLYDIFWTSEVDDELKALAESKPGLEVIY
ncbi:ribonuclease inhibitor-like isoform X2 [Tiliqua scincoides]|uniref:ribonuclease inhibitor-like isoform X2 n=1 Tax=Tiliqua scincoides TaxID=71010 RepID=UPI0034627352